jgi:hypothetical protein
LKPSDEVMIVEWKSRQYAKEVVYSADTDAAGWDDLAVALEAQFSKLGELLMSEYAGVPFDRIYFDFIPDIGQVMAIPCAQDITEKNDFPMLLKLDSTFLTSRYAELPESDSDGDDPVWDEAFDANVALLRAALIKALSTPSSQEALRRLRQRGEVMCYLQIWDSDENIEPLPV